MTNVQSTSLVYEIGSGIDVESVLAAQHKCFDFSHIPEIHGDMTEVEALACEWHEVAGTVMNEMLGSLRRRFGNKVSTDLAKKTLEVVWLAYKAEMLEINDND
jgi:hypothetical protein